MLMENVSANLDTTLSVTLVEFVLLPFLMTQSIVFAELHVKPTKFGMLQFEHADAFQDIISLVVFAVNAMLLLKFITKLVNAAIVLMDIIKLVVKDAMEFVLLYVLLIKTGSAIDVSANLDII